MASLETFKNAGEDVPKQPTGEATSSKPVKAGKNRSRKNRGRNKPGDPAQKSEANSTSARVSSSNSIPNAYPEGKRIFQEQTAVPAFGDKTLRQEINVVGYRTTVSEFYKNVLLPAYPNLWEYMTQHEWMHLFDIFLAYRIQLVQTKTMGVKAPPQHRIQLPDDIPIPQPIWVLLATLGKTGIADQGMSYIPSLRYMDNAETPTLEDYQAVEDGYTIDFLANWERLVQYHTAHPEQQPEREWDQDRNAEFVPQFEYPEEFPLEEDESHREYVQRLGDMVTATRNLHREVRNLNQNQRNQLLNRFRRSHTMIAGYLVRRDVPIPDNQPIPNADNFTLLEVDGDVNHLNATWNAARRYLKNSQRPKPDRQTEARDDQFEPGDLQVLIGTSIGYQPWLLKRYLRAITVIRQFVLLSKDLPIDPAGDIAWTLTAQNSAGYWQTNVPSKKDTPLDSTMTQLIARFTLLDTPHRPWSWSILYQGNIRDVGILRAKFLSAALLKGAPVIRLDPG